jgi:hypothetical protein
MAKTGNQKEFFVIYQKLFRRKITLRYTNIFAYFLLESVHLLLFGGFLRTTEYVTGGSCWWARTLGCSEASVGYCELLPKFICRC